MEWSIFVVQISIGHYFWIISRKLTRVFHTHNTDHHVGRLPVVSGSFVCARAMFWKGG